MEKDKKIILNQFIAKLGLLYDNKKQKYIGPTGQVIENITAYLKATFKSVLGRTPSTSEQAYIEQWLMAPYDFENVSYKTYLKTIVDFQNPKMVRDLKDNYDYYLESIQNACKSKQCIYISGVSGSGKTTYAKILASKYYDENEIFISSGGSHPFDEYYGEKCIIIDDFRDSVLAYNDLLRLLDNNTSSNVGARYHNKSLARCELIILTSVKSPLSLYQGIDEERYQLYRRMSYFKITDNYLEYMIYDRSRDRYDSSKIINISKDMNSYFESNKNENVVDINKLFEIEIETVEISNQEIDKIFG